MHWERWLCEFVTAHRFFFDVKTWEIELTYRIKLNNSKQQKYYLNLPIILVDRNILF